LAELEDGRAESFLSDAYYILQKRAARIKDRETRRQFLENVSTNRAIATAWENRKK